MDYKNYNNNNNNNSSSSSDPAGRREHFFLFLVGCFATSSKALRESSTNSMSIKVTKSSISVYWATWVVCNGEIALKGYRGNQISENGTNEIFDSRVHRVAKSFLSINLRLVGFYNNCRNEILEDWKSIFHNLKLRWL